MNPGTEENGLQPIIEQLCCLIAEDLDLNLRPEAIDPNAALLDDGLALDSFAIATLITLSERRFGIEFSEEELTMDSFASVRALAATIAAHCVDAEARTASGTAQPNGAPASAIPLHRQ